jgi:ATP-dependent helicase HrpA
VNPEPPAGAAPPPLPIAVHRDEIRRAIAGRPVTIVCGETGSGKSTQLPQIALEVGRGRERLIGCTQPRRLAALALARRVAQERGTPVGGFVGYQHRYERRLSADTRIKFMTDGILLAEARGDPLLRAYDTLILDEAHERSLNVDLLLGLLKRLLARRRDLRVIVSSATLEAERLADFFGGAPVIRVAGRGYPVEVRYRPPEDADDADLAGQVAEALAERDAAGEEGDVLVFLPGERDIRDTADALAGRKLAGTEVLPLLASLPAEQQERAFRLSDRRRVILATNVAETSLTLPGIRCVIDSGLARISRYSHRTQVQRLHVEPIAQASAEQRAGRCGRVGPGVCIRLYAADDLARRDRFTDPEILRTSLAGVILTMLAHGLGPIEEFPFLDPPSPATVRAGFRELEELGAVNREGRITPLGQRLALLPVEPRFGRMLLAAHEGKVLAPALIVVAALETDDPRRRPLDCQADADAAHARFRTPQSDFAADLRLWRWFEETAARASSSAARRLCREHFLSYGRMREWRDLRDQLAGYCRLLGLDPASDQGGDEALHRALLAGLLGRIGQRDPEAGDYRGARGLRFAIFPGSGLAKKPPAWIMAGELMETSRLYARQAAAIDPSWIEAAAGERCSRTFHSPAWDAEHGFVRALERVTFQGLLLAEGRPRDYSRIDPAACRALFLRHGVVEAALPQPPRVIADNARVLEAWRRREHQTRRCGRIADIDSLVAFYDARLPPNLCTAAELRRWAQRASPAEIESLRLDPAMFDGDAGADEGFPQSLRIGRHEFPLTYLHAPGDPADGITCTVPSDRVGELRAWRAEWLVPGALPDKVGALLAGLPLRLRRLFEPLDETATLCLARLGAGQQPLREALARALSETRGVRVPPDAWHPEGGLPDYLRVRFRVVDDDGRELAQGRDLAAILDRFSPATAGAILSGEERWHRDGLIAWTCGTLPERIDVGRAGWPVAAWPALVDAGASAGLRLFSDPDEAGRQHRGGVLRLLRLALGREARALLRPAARSRAETQHLAALGLNPAGFDEDISWCACERAFLEGRPLPRDDAAFAACLRDGLPRLSVTVGETRQFALAVTHAAAERMSDVDALGRPAADSSTEDLRGQIAWLVCDGFLRHVPWERLRHLPRYLEAARLRIERLRWNPAGDAARLAEVTPRWLRYRRAVEAPLPPGCDAVKLNEYRWLVEEFRVSLFAQTLGTAVPVSAKRLDALWETAWS